MHGNPTSTNPNYLFQTAWGNQNLSEQVNACPRTSNCTIQPNIACFGPEIAMLQEYKAGCLGIVSINWHGRKMFGSFGIFLWHTSVLTSLYVVISSWEILLLNKLNKVYFWQSESLQWKLKGSLASRAEFRSISISFYLVRSFALWTDLTLTWLDGLRLSAIVVQHRIFTSVTVETLPRWRRGHGDGSACQWRTW